MVNFDFGQSGNWDSVTVQGIVSVTLKEFIAPVNLNTNKVHLTSGMTCVLQDGFFTDLEGGQTFWDTLPRDACNFNKYKILYQGRANKTIDLDSDVSTQVMFSITDKDTLFAWTVKGRENNCGFTFLKTEHPRLFVIETMQDGLFTGSK